MAIIYSYPQTTNLQSGDLLLISKMDQEGRPTQSVSISTLAAFIGPGGGNISGGGTLARIPKFDPDGTTLADSLLEDDGATVSCDGDFDVNLDSTFNGNVSIGSPTYALFDGGIEFSTDLDMTSNAITDVQDPTNPQDAATKNYVDTRNDLKVVDVTLSPAEVISFNGGNTISLIPAPGAGKLLAVLNVILFLDYNSLPYNFVAGGISDGVNFYIGTDKSRSINSTILNSIAAQYVSYDFPNSDVNTDIQPNVAFTIQASAGMTVSQGNSPLKLSILYREVVLP